MKRAVAALSVVMCLAGLTACSKTGSAAPEVKPKATTTSVTLELGTPDKAIKSYWAVRDSARSKFEELVKQFNVVEQVRATEDQMTSVTDGSLFKSLSPSGHMGSLETFSRDIIDVKIESESRAVVTAVIKNTTPIPPGAEVTKHDEERRRDGDRYRYVLEKSQAGWRVSEIWEWGTSTYPAKDWRKLAPRDSKPYVASLTHDGI